MWSTAVRRGWNGQTNSRHIKDTLTWPQYRHHGDQLHSPSARILRIVVLFTLQSLCNLPNYHFCVSFVPLGFPSKFLSICPPSILYIRSMDVHHVSMQRQHGTTNHHRDNTPTRHRDNMIHLLITETTHLLITETTWYTYSSQRQHTYSSQRQIPRSSCGSPVSTGPWSRYSGLQIHLVSLRRLHAWSARRNNVCGPRRSSS